VVIYKFVCRYSFVYLTQWFATSLSATEIRPWSKQSFLFYRDICHIMLAPSLNPICTIYMYCTELILSLSIQHIHACSLYTYNYCMHEHFAFSASGTDHIRFVHLISQILKIDDLSLLAAKEKQLYIQNFPMQV
jgi:hypothetical protein